MDRMDQMDRQSYQQVQESEVQETNVGPRRRVFVSEVADPLHAHPGGERDREEIEYVAVPRKVKYHEKLTNIPVKRHYHEYEPRWQVQHVKRRIPKEVVEYTDNVTEVPHKRVIDEYVEVPYDAGTEVKCVPRVEVQEREIEVAVPRVQWIEKEQIIPEVRECVRYVQADHNIERVIRYVPDTPSIAGDMPPRSPTTSDVPQRSPRGPQFVYMGGDEVAPRFEHFDESGRPIENPDLDSPLQGVVMPRSARIDVKSELQMQAPVTVDIPVPFMVPRPVCIPVDVPLMRFRDNFVPIPCRRHVTPKLTFTDDIFDVPCAKEKPILVVQDYMRPVPVDVHIRVKEKDVKVKPMDPTELSQADMHAMWMRANADLLETWREKHAGKYPRGYHGPEDSKVPLKETDWEASLVKESQEAPPIVADPNKEDLGPLPLHPGHPLMMTYLQNQWIQNPTTITHGMYTPEFFRHHYAALNAQLDPQCHQINLTEQQMEQLGPMPHEQLPNPWKVVNLLKEHEGIPGEPLSP